MWYHISRNGSGESMGQIEYIGDYLRQTVSFFDTSDEVFYQGLVLGLPAILNNRYMVRSNRESGDGRFDIRLFPKNDQLPGILIELKVTKEKNVNLHALALLALSQIERKHYETEMLSQGITCIFKYGVAFCGKNVEVHMQQKYLSSFAR